MIRENTRVTICQFGTTSSTVPLVKPKEASILIQRLYKYICIVSTE